ncbi:GIY-YIG nuclease family protein [Nonomuraea sp. ATR24]|uniref:GIY-YIG nuclease family protein n=1 Tax=Nonomuraea sp. ATR24 TaxID=1676744 RepID=UPI0035BEDB81
MSTRRYRLKPWLIRALIPEGVMGSYVLWGPAAPVYVGRSETSLRRRLIEHSQNWPNSFFTYDVAFTAQNAYTMECSLFHALGDRTTNVDHPQRSAASDPGCPFCLDTLKEIRSNRLRLKTVST